MHEGFTSHDGEGDNAWGRVFCAAVADGSCTIIVFQHHFEKINQYFDHRTEANLALVSGGSAEVAMNRLKMDLPEHPTPAAYRRMSRLLSHGGMCDAIKDCLSERGLLRAVAYAEDDTKPEDTRMAMFDRAGFRTEQRDDKGVRVLDLED